MKFFKKESEKIENYFFKIISILCKYIADSDKAFENLPKLFIVLVTWKRIAVEDHPKNFEIVGKVIFDVLNFLDHLYNFRKIGKIIVNSEVEMVFRFTFKLDLKNFWQIDMVGTFQVVWNSAECINKAIVAIVIFDKKPLIFLFIFFIWFFLLQVIE